MLKLTESGILERSMAPYIYERGRTYYRQGKVQTVKFNEKKRSFRGIIQGMKLYTVEVSFDEEGRINRSYCTCGEYGGGWGDCSHIVAFLFRLKELDRAGAFKDFQAKQSARGLIHSFERMSMKEKIPIRLETTLEFSGGQAFASFRVGQRRLYVVRNLQQFLWHIQAEEDMEFGKEFHYNPYWHTFDEKDRPIIELLLEAYELQQWTTKDHDKDASHSLFHEKRMALPAPYLRRMLNFLEGRRFRTNIHGRVYREMEVVRDTFPVSFHVEGREGDLQLRIGSPVPLAVLTSDGEYILEGERIYRLPPRQRQYLEPFLEFFSDSREGHFLFSGEEKDKFMMGIFPYLHKVGPVALDDSLKDMILREELKPEVYLDKEGKRLTIRVLFRYGEQEVNPFQPSGKGVGGNDRLLVRDVEKEKNILDLLERFGFRVHVDRVFLEGESDIFRFLWEGLPSLQKISDIFYSEEFKQNDLRRSLSCSGGIRLNSQTDLLEITFQVEGVDGDELPRLMEALRERKRYYRLRDGAFLSLEGNGIQGMIRLMDYVYTRGGLTDLHSISLPKYEAFYLEDCLQELDSIPFQRDSLYREMVQRLRAPQDLELAPPSSLKDVLRQYQKTGFQWLKTLSWYGLGGILADDMGLGKTLQMLALILSAKEEKGRIPSLVIAPTSLIYNWQAEVEKFAPALKTQVISGERAERKKLLDCCEEIDLYITSYPLIRRDIEDYQKIHFRFCILDEAQHIKNPASQASRAVKKIKAESRFAMTGTPMENGLRELWSIFDFILPGYLFHYSRFSESYEVPIVKQQDSGAKEALARRIRPFLLRRMKEDVLRELPEKIEHKVVVELTHGQKKVYLAYWNRIRQEIEGEVRKKGLERSHIKILAGLTRLRQICCHPGVFLDNYRGDSGKMLLLEEVLNESIDGGHRVLVFSQFTRMLDIIRKTLDIRNIRYLYLDGSTESEERGNLVNRFNDGEGDVFLISLKAGGAGLNLTGADVVIHYDPWWNPAVEDQATDRAYRIGQTRPVHVMKLVAKGTIEERIFDLQQRKKRLVDDVIQPGQTLLSQLGEEELRLLFELES